MSFQLRILQDNFQETIPAFSQLEGFKVSEKLIAQTLRSVLLNLRAGNAHTKTRGEVSGGGRKPWKQKGTGRARHGSTRSPIWVGGGVTFGPRNTTNWHSKINKTAKLSTLKFLVKQVLDNNLAFYLPADLKISKTKEAQVIIDKLNPVVLSRRTLLVYTTADKDGLTGFVNTDLQLLNVENMKLNLLASKLGVIMTTNAKDYLEKRFELNK
jgi:50S ribosomal protein L4